MTPPTEDRETQLRRLHAKGLTDREIAGRLGVSFSTVCRDRHTLGLEPNGHARLRGPKKFDPKDARELYDEGLTDAAIADRLGVSRQTVQKWRSGRGLASQGKPGRKPKTADRTQ